MYTTIVHDDVIIVTNAKDGKGGRLDIDEIVMIKMLVLQQWQGLSDPELERQVNDRRGRWCPPHLHNP